MATLSISRTVSRITAKASFPNLAVRMQVVWPDQIPRIDIGAVDELERAVEPDLLERRRLDLVSTLR